jgi:hypothetical protein
MELQRVSAMIAQSSWDPSGDNQVDEGIVADLIEITLSKQDKKLTAIVRDIFTQIVTVFDGFDELLAQAKHGYRPAFDTRFREQRFLNTEYFRELSKKRSTEPQELLKDGPQEQVE